MVLKFGSNSFNKKGGKIGGLEDWKIGRLEDWRIGGLEDWRIGGFIIFNF
jgi:hypothetical protein